jgi:hypothetical protein
MLAAQIVQMAACAMVVAYAAARADVDRPAAAHVSAHNLQSCKVWRVCSSSGS